jgi:hypothetical protein
MRTVKWLSMGVMSLALPAWAAGDEPDLSARTRALAVKSLEIPQASAPFLRSQDPLEQMPFAVPADLAGPSLSCGNRAMCYDARQHNLVYRGARGYMPRIDGFTAEGLALRRDRLILRYTFK